MEIKKDPDERPSAMGFGYVSVVVLIVEIGFFVLLDIESFLQNVKYLKNSFQKAWWKSEGAPPKKKHKRHQRGQYSVKKHSQLRNNGGYHAHVSLETVNHAAYDHTGYQMATSILMFWMTSPQLAVVRTSQPAIAMAV